MSIWQKISKGVVNFVNPKLVYFNRPLLLAISISGATGILLFVIFMSQLNLCGETVSVTGDDKAHFRYAEKGYCVMQSMYMHTMNTAAGNMERVVTKPCKPREYFVNDHYLNAGGKISWTICDEPGKAEWFDNALRDYGQCQADINRPGCADPTAHSPENSAGPCIQTGKAPFLIEWKTTSESCPPVATLGASLGYAGYIESFVTLLIAGSCLLGGCIKYTSHGKAIFDLADDSKSAKDIEAASEQEELAKCVKEVKERLEAVEKEELAKCVKEITERLGALEKVTLRGSAKRDDADASVVKATTLPNAIDETQ